MGGQTSSGKELNGKFGPAASGYTGMSLATEAWKARKEYKILVTSKGQIPQEDERREHTIDGKPASASEKQWIQTHTAKGAAPLLVPCDFRDEDAMKRNAVASDLKPEFEKLKKVHATLTADLTTKPQFKAAATNNTAGMDFNAGIAPQAQEYTTSSTGSVPFEYDNQ